MHDLQRTPAACGWVLFIVIGQVIALSHALNHVSDTPSLLGRYSNSYAVGVGVVVALALLWAMMLWQAKRVWAWLQARDARLRIAAVAMLLLGLWGITYFIGTINLKIHLKIVQSLAINVLIGALVLVASLPTDNCASRRWRAAVVVLCGLFLFVWVASLPLYIVFSPDEAHWAAIAGNFLYEGKIYGRMLFEPVHAISPGVGYVNALYGLLIDTFGWDIRLGRYFQLVAYLVGIAGIAFATYAMSRSSWASFASACAALLSRSFLPALSYRPDHFVMPLAMWTIGLALWGFRVERRAWVWHMGAGLLVIFTLQAHAVGICLIAALSAYYGIRGAQALWRRDWMWLFSLLGYVMGASIGSALYFVTNILSVGGLDVYLEYLRNYSASSSKFPAFIFAPLDGVLVMTSIVWLLWRQAYQQQHYIGILLMLVVSIFLLDRRGYSVPHQGIFYLPVGIFLAEVMLTRRQRDWALMVVALCLFLVLVRTPLLQWDAAAVLLREGRLAEHPFSPISRAVAARLQPDEMVIGTHELVWGLGNRANFYSLISEGTSQFFRRYPTKTQVWEELRPDVVVEISKSLIIPEGLQLYMAREGFQPCETFTVSDRIVTFYRPTCAIPTPTTP